MSELNFEKNIQMREAGIEENLQLDKEIEKYIERHAPKVEEIKSVFTEAAKNYKEDRESLEFLIKEIDLRVVYLRPKSRDTEEEMKYVEKLDLMLKKLKELL